MDRRTSLVYSRNGTVQEISEDLSSPVAAGVIILICFLIGVAYNFVVVTAILYSIKLRRSPFHVVLVLLSGVCLLDCLTNESFAFGSLFNSEAPLCETSAALFQLLLLNHSAALGLLCLERTLVLHDYPVTVRTCLGAVFFTWIFALIFVSPLLATSDIHYFPNRNSCSTVVNNSWITVINLFGFLLIWIATIITIVFFIRYINNFLKEQYQLTIFSVFPASNTKMQISPIPLMSCPKNKISCTISFFYIILLVPQIISVSVTLFFVPSFKPDPWIDPRSPSEQIRVVITNDMEPLFAYLRYMYNVVVPIVIITTDKDIRLQSRSVFCCRRNVISSVDSGFASELNSSRSDTQSSLTFCDVRTPILYITPGGLHLRAPQIGLQDQPERASISGLNLKPTSVFCDLIIDSITEPFDSKGNEETRLIKDDSDEIETGSPVVRRNVRFSSKVDAIPPSESGVSSQSDTRVIRTPLVAGTGDRQLENSVGGTYSKF